MQTHLLLLLLQKSSPDSLATVAPLPFLSWTTKADCRPCQALHMKQIHSSVSLHLPYQALPLEQIHDGLPLHLPCQASSLEHIHDSFHLHLPSWIHARPFVTDDGSLWEVARTSARTGDATSVPPCRPMRSKQTTAGGPASDRQVVVRTRPPPAELPIMGPPSSVARIWITKRERRSFKFSPTSDAKWVLALHSLLESVFSLYISHFMYG